jgi:hypothetical protein
MPELRGLGRQPRHTGFTNVIRSKWPGSLPYSQTCLKLHGVITWLFVLKWSASAVDARHRHHVAGREALKQFEQFAPVVVRARHLLAINLGTTRAAQLLKLRVERLPVGANAGIAKAAILGVSSGHILREA